MAKVSLLMNVIDRYNLTRQCVDQAIANMGWDDFEFLVCDNGSTDKRVIEYCSNLPNLSYHRLNDRNQGNYQMLNQLMLRATGKYICVIDPDIALPKDWLKKLVTTYRTMLQEAKRIPGIAGIHTVRGHEGKRMVGSVRVLEKPNGIFGTKFYGRHVLQVVGYYVELSKYGFGDTNYGRRCNRAGMLNFYLNGIRAEHRGTGGSDAGTYRDMKNHEMRRVHESRHQMWEQHGREYIYLPPPERTEA